MSPKHFRDWFYEFILWFVDNENENSPQLAITVDKYTRWKRGRSVITLKGQLDIKFKTVK